MLKSQIKIVKNGYLCSIFALRFPELPRSILQCSGTGQPQQPRAGDRICKLLSVTLWCAAEYSLCTMGDEGVIGDLSSESISAFVQGLHAPVLLPALVRSDLDFWLNSTPI